MAEVLALTDILGRIEMAIARQATATDALAVQAAATEAWVTIGDVNVQGVVAALESRLAESEKKLADALQAVSSTMMAMQTGMAAQTPAPATPPGIAVSAAAVNSAADGSPQFDPWANAAAASTQQSFTPNFARVPPQSHPGLVGDQLKSKDFAHISAFDGDFGQVPGLG